MVSEMVIYLWQMSEMNSVNLLLLVIAKARSAPLMMVVSIEHGDKH